QCGDVAGGELTIAIAVGASACGTQRRVGDVAGDRRLDVTAVNECIAVEVAAVGAERDDEKTVGLAGGKGVAGGSGVGERAGFALRIGDAGDGDWVGTDVDLAGRGSAEAGGGAAGGSELDAGVGEHAGEAAESVAGVHDDIESQSGGLRTGNGV